MGNAFLEKQKAKNLEYFKIGIDVGMQMACDMISLALHDPEVMKKDTFAESRLRPVMDAALKKREQFAPAWGGGPEADYYQEKMDIALADAYGEIDPFEERYPYCKENQYWPKGYKGGR